MKVTYTSEHKAFQPVTISITCETPEELFALWHRFNVGGAYIRKQSNAANYNVPDGKITTRFVWELLNKEVQKLLKREYY